MVYVENETSSAFFQTTPNAKDSVKLYSSAQKGAVLTFSDLIKPKHIAELNQNINGKSPDIVHMMKDSFVQEFSQDTGRRYNQKIASLYSKQLDHIFPETQHINIDGVNVFSKGISSVLKDDTSLMHYIFKNPDVLGLMADHFAGVKSGWNTPNEKGEHSLFVQLKSAKDVTTARESYYSYDIDKITAGIDQKNILPRTALYFIYNFLEVGLISLGGTAHAPYLTKLKGRMLDFLADMNQKIEAKELPACPVSSEVIAARIEKIRQTPTTLSIGGLSVAANQNNELYSYADFLANEKMPAIDPQRITLQDAINANMPSLISHKCMKDLNTFKVGAEIITVPQISLIGNKKDDVIKHYPSKIWKNTL